MSKRVIPKKNVKDLSKENPVGTRDYYCKLAKIQILRLEQNQAIWVIDHQAETKQPFSTIMQRCLVNAGAPIHGDFGRAKRLALNYFKKNGPAEGEIDNRTGTVRFYFRITMAQYDWLLKMRQKGWTLQRLLVRELEKKGMVDADKAQEDLRAVRSSDLDKAQERLRKTHRPKTKVPEVLIGDHPQQAAARATQR